MLKRATIVALAMLCLPSVARAQQTIFNVPSREVLEPGRLYLETDVYFRPWETDSGRTAFGSLRAVYGALSTVEIGINSGPFDFRESNQPFVDFAMKWRPVQADLGEGENAGEFRFYLGTNMGIGVRGEEAGNVRDLAYAAASLEVPTVATRLTVGPYFATSRVFADPSRGGVLAAIEQPIPVVKGLTAAADWFSGDGAFLTVGAIWTVGPVTLYGGYGFSNDGRADDLLVIELGVTLDCSGGKS